MFEEGINLVKECQKQLQEAELKIKKLLDDGTSKFKINKVLKTFLLDLRKKFHKYEKTIGDSNFH